MSEYQDARDRFIDRFSETATVTRKTLAMTADNRRVRATEDATIYKSVPAMASPLPRILTGKEGDRVVTLADYEVYIGVPGVDPATLDLKQDDNIAIGAITYRVVGTDKGTSGALCLTVTCKRVTL